MTAGDEKQSNLGCYKIDMLTVHILLCVTFHVGMLGGLDSQLVSHQLIFLGFALPGTDPLCYLLFMLLLVMQ